MKPYPQYKNSDVLWLGDVPEHWEVSPLKRVAKNIIEVTTEKKPSELYVALEHIESKTGYLRRNRKSNFQGQVKRFGTEDILFGKLRPYLAKVVLPNEPGVCVGEILAIRPNNKLLDKSFVAKAILSQKFIDIVSSSTYGAKMPRAEWTFIGNLGFPLSPLSEQQQISRYLDWQTSKVDKFIKAKKKLIALLKEQKQNVINEAVTKGINPDVEMKDSGVEWIGEVPAHWEVRKLKFIARIKNGKDYKEVETETGYPVIGSGGQFAFASQFMYEGESVLFGRKGTIDRPLYINGRFWTVDTMFYTEISKKIIPKFLHYSALSFPFSYYSTKTALPSVTQKDLGNHSLVVPPIIEQHIITNHIEKEIALIDKIIARTEREIELIQEYRTRLVSDVVTGKVDVRSVEIPEFEPVEADMEIQDDEASEDELITEGIEE